MTKSLGSVVRWFSVVARVTWGAVVATLCLWWSPAQAWAAPPAFNFDGTYNVIEADQTFGGGFQSSRCLTPFTNDPTKVTRTATVTVKTTGDKVTFTRDGRAVLVATLGADGSSFTGDSPAGVIPTMKVTDGKFERDGTFRISQPRINADTSSFCFQVDIHGSGGGSGASSTGTTGVPATGSASGSGAGGSGGVSGTTIAAIAATAAAAAAAAALLKRRQAIDTECQALLSRYSLMVAQRVRRLAALEGNAATFKRAGDAMHEAARAREDLVAQRNIAVGLLGASAVVAVAAMAAAASAAAASAAALSVSAFEATGVGMAEGSFELVEFGKSLSLLARGKAVVATAWERAGAGVGATGITAVVTAVNGVLNEFDEAVARQEGLYREVEQRCTKEFQEIRELDVDIGNVLDALRTCPKMDQEYLEDPRGPLPSMPGDPIRG